MGSYLVRTFGEPPPAVDPDAEGRRRVRRQYVQDFLRDFWEDSTLERGTAEVFRSRVGVDRERWRARRRELLDALGSSDDDEAISELLVLDPREMANPYIIARVLRARFDARQPLVSRTFLGARPRDFDLQVDEQAKRAREFLETLGAKVATTGVGRGAKAGPLPSTLNWSYQRCRRQAKAIAALAQDPDETQDDLLSRALAIAKVREGPGLIPEYRELKLEACRVLLRLDLRKASGPPPIEAGARLLLRADLGLTEAEVARRLRRRRTSD